MYLANLSIISIRCPGSQQLFSYSKLLACTFQPNIQCVSTKSSPFFIFVITFLTVNQFKQYLAET